MTKCKANIGDGQLWVKSGKRQIVHEIWYFMLFLLEKKHNEANKNINDAKIKNINTIIFSSILALIVMVWSSHDTVHIGQSGKSVVHAGSCPATCIFICQLLCVFLQLNCRKCLDKLQEWQGAAGQMKKHLPAGDEVLAHWFRILNEFKQDLPLLHKLSNDALKVRKAAIVITISYV